jgi:hypothetical protein
MGQTLIITQLTESVCVHVRVRVSRTVTSDRRERVCCPRHKCAHTHTHTRRQLSEFKRQAHFNEVNFKFTLDIVFYSTRWGKSTEIRMERTSENSSFIQLEGMHYLSCFPFFLPAKCMQAAAAAAAHATNAHATNAHAFFLFFYLSPNACTSPHTQCNECMP